MVARKSHLVPTVKTDIFLIIAYGNQMLFKHCDDYLIVDIRWSKTNQFGGRVIRTLLPC